jgi:hypothetical protein
MRLRLREDQRSSRRRYPKRKPPPCRARVGVEIKDYYSTINLIDFGLQSRQNWRVYQLENEHNSYAASHIKRKRATKAEMFARFDAIFDIVAEIQPCSVRQAYYQAVVRAIIDKTETDYDKVQTAWSSFGAPLAFPMAGSRTERAGAISRRPIPRFRKR